MGKNETLTEEEIDLRRRARRRLVGAIALALLAVVVLPMLFDPEPKPLGPDVDIRIPDQTTPFVPEAPEPAQPGTGAPATPAPTIAPPAPLPTPPAAAEAKEGPASGPAEAPPPKATPAAKPQAAAKPRPSEPPPPKPKTKPTPQPSPPAEAAREETAPGIAEPPRAKGHFLQLGAFGNETYANTLADKARKAGFKVVVQESGGQFRVRVGPYEGRDEAVAVQDRLREKGFGSVLLGP